MDDGSTEDVSVAVETGRQLQYLFGAVFRLVRNEEPIGYGPANNAGVQAATAKFIALLNSDAHVINGWLRPLIQTIQYSSSIGMVCPVEFPVSKACSSPHQPCRRSVRDAPLVNLSTLEAYSNVRPQNWFQSTVVCVCVAGLWTAAHCVLYRQPDACYSGFRSMLVGLGAYAGYVSVSSWNKSIYQLIGLAGRAYTRRGWQSDLGGEQLHPG